LFKSEIGTDKDIRVVFVHSGDASFIETDRKILENRFHVLDFKYFGKKGILDLLKIIRKSNIGFAWFEHDHAFFTVLFSKVLGKKSIVVSADSYSFTEIWNDTKPSFISKLFTKLAVRHADLVLVDSRYKEKSVLNHVKGDNVKLLYLGFDADKFTPSYDKEDLVITVGQVTKATLWRKGLKMFVKAAKNFPEIKFVLIGRFLDNSIEDLKKIASKNVKFTGWVSDDELISYMQKAKVYAQLSAMESFGCSIAEAMLCGCIPVVTNNGAIPEVVGDAGFYAEYGDLDSTIEALEMALKSDNYEKSRKRIKNKFPLENREKQIINNIHDLIKNN